MKTEERIKKITIALMVVMFLATVEGTGALSWIGNIVLDKKQETLNQKTEIETSQINY